MAEVNPYVNTEGRTLLIYTQNGSTWTSSRLPSGMGASLSQDGRARNIWDSGSKTVEASNKVTGTAGWILPSPSDAGDINSVNVIIINNSNSINYGIPNTNISINAGQSIGASLPLGFTALNVLLTGSNTVLSTTLSSSNQTNPFQILPLPDQVVTINANGSVSVSSAVGMGIPMTRLTIHNCFNSTLFIRLRPCDGALGQNFGQIVPNETIGLSVYSTYEIFLESGDGMIVSGSFNIINADAPNRPPIGTLFFQTNGGISTTSCSGLPMPLPPGPSPGPTPPPTPPVSTFQIAWNTASFPVPVGNAVGGTGRCLGDTLSAVTTSVTSIIPVHVNDIVQFLSSDGQLHDLVQTDKNWIRLTTNIMFGPFTPGSTSFNQSVKFPMLGCFFFISTHQSNIMRLRISITDTNGNNGCTVPCPGLPDVPVVIPPTVIVVPDDDQSFLERWWWAILICIIVVILIIGLIIYLIWYNNKKPKITTTVTHTAVVAPAGTAGTAFVPVSRQGLPAYGNTGPYLVSGPQGDSALASAPPLQPINLPTGNSTSRLVQL